MMMLPVYLFLMGVSVHSARTGFGLFPHGASYVLDLSSQEFRSRVLTSSGDERTAWVVLFYGTFCGHCRSFAPVYTKLADELYKAFGDRARFGAVDLHNMSNRDLAIEFNYGFVPQIEVRYIASNRAMVSKIPVNPQDSLSHRIREQLELVLALNPVPTTTETPLTTTPLPVTPGGKGPSWPIFFSPEGALEDAVKYLAFILNIEVFRGSTTTLTSDGIANLVSLLSLCRDTLPSTSVADECQRLIGYISQSSALTVEQWTGLLNTSAYFRIDEGSQTFRTCDTPTCAFWRLLHYFSLGNGGAASITPSDAMKGIRMTMDKFCSCQPCHEHFLNGYDECLFGRCDVEDSQRSWQDVTLWLWRFHNAASSRIHNMVIEWPERETCPKCRYFDGTINESEVYRYLVTAFGTNQVVEGVQNIKLAPTTTTKGYIQVNTAFGNYLVAAIYFVI
jgi:thiol-disulfide isomerase/thioredoxin